jgi:hypothetical protein
MKKGGQRSGLSVCPEEGNGQFWHQAHWAGFQNSGCALFAIDGNDELLVAVGGGRSQASPRISLLFDNGTALYRGFVCFISDFLIRLLLRGFGFLALRLGKIFLRIRSLCQQC